MILPAAILPAVTHSACVAAADAIRGAGAILVTAGAGMGVDSGLPDFRGPEGFWRAYPPYQKLGLEFEDLANPRWFSDDPALAWGFYGHRLNLYRRTEPHDGFQILKRMNAGAVFTSNVDGHFLRTGFARVCEVHGAIETFQCTRADCTGLWDAPPADIDIDDVTLRAREPFPTCPTCGALARPNILMFGDWGFVERRSEEQHVALTSWLSAHEDVVVVECGAGSGIPTVRRYGERLMNHHGAKLIRINVREAEGPPGTVSVSLGALAALREIESLLTS